VAAAQTATQTVRTEQRVPRHVRAASWLLCTLSEHARGPLGECPVGRSRDFTRRRICRARGAVRTHRLVIISASGAAQFRPRRSSPAPGGRRLVIRKAQAGGVLNDAESDQALGRILGGMSLSFTCAPAWSGSCGKLKTRGPRETMLTDLPSPWSVQRRIRQQWGRDPIPDPLGCTLWSPQWFADSRSAERPA
jgi:hypothetical protein